MNLLDLAIVVALVAAAVGGWRLGFAARALGWCGLFAGLALGVWLVPGVVTRFGGTSEDSRMTVALVFLVVVASVGQAVGLAVGGAARRAGRAAGPLPHGDRAAGAALGVLGVLAVVWLALPSLATTTGWPARAVRDSAVVAWIDRWAPDQPATVQAWARRITEAPYPVALDPLEGPPDPGAPPPATLPADVDAAVRPSTVLVSGQACRRVQQGSGFVVAPQTVVTNAHVVAGEDDTVVTTLDGTEHEARTVAFDPGRDVAVLDVPSLAAPPLALADAEVGDVGAVYGHPGGGPLRIAPARVADRFPGDGYDIYHSDRRVRDVLLLAAELEPGDSGAALVDVDGRVIGVAFAVDPGRAATAYALSRAEVQPVLDEAGDEAIDTGECVVG